jgi:hypothetical protein
VITLPAPDEPKVLLTPIAVVGTPDAIVRFTIAMAPFEMIVAPMPEATHVYVPDPAKQSNVTPAAVAAALAVAEMETILLSGYVSVHCKAVSSLPVAEVKFRFRDTVPFDPAVPEDKLKVSAVPTDGTRPMVALCETLLRAAVMIALSLPLKVPAVAAKVAEAEPPPTEAEAGTVSTALLLDSVIEEPPVEAA